MAFKGVDVSSHRGDIDWKKVKGKIDFVIIRAGFGRNNIDTKLERNIKGCEENGIPYGLYWFSYALSTEEAKNEANYICDIADKHKPAYPICFDWEYDSDKYASENKVNMTNETRKNFARSFLNRVEERGYYAMIYSNIDYLNKGFYDLTSRYDLWLAVWGVSAPTKSCGIWQSSSKCIVEGIPGNVDTDVAYKNYPYLCKKKNDEKPKENTITLEDVKNEYWKKYLDLSADIILGKYGNGKARKDKLLSLGYDYDFAQSIVNVKLGTNGSLESVKEKFWAKYLNIATDIISGKYGNGNNRKNALKRNEYDYNFAQTIVNVKLCGM